MQESNEMNNAGTIRLLTFIALLAGCVYICFYFGSNISKISGFLSMRSAAELEQYLTSISEDLTPLILFASYYIKSFGIGFYVAALIICSLVTLIATMIVFLIFRCVSIRRTSYVSESEYKLTKHLFFAVFILSTIAPVFFYGFKSLIWSPFLNFAWFLSALIYVITLENRHLAGMRQNQNPVFNQPLVFNQPPDYNLQNQQQQTQQQTQPQNQYQPTGPYPPQNPLTDQSPYQNSYQNPYQPPQNQNTYQNPYDPDSRIR